LPDLVSWQKLAADTVDYIYSSASELTPSLNTDEILEKAKNFKDSLVFHVSLGYNIVNHSEETHRWWDRITDNIVLGALPFHNRNHLTRLTVEENIRSVLIMCRDFEFNPVLGTPVTKQDWENHNVKVYHSPTKDFEAPPVEELLNCVAFINKQIENDPKGSVYVHCKAGRGRSVAVVVCFLISNLGLTTDESIQHITSKRSHINMGTSQTEACRKYEQEHRPPGNRNPFPDPASDIIPTELENSFNENDPAVKKGLPKEQDERANNGAEEKLGEGEENTGQKNETEGNLNNALSIENE